VPLQAGDDDVVVAGLDEHAVESPYFGLVALGRAGGVGDKHVDVGGGDTSRLLGKLHHPRLPSPVRLR
jgi:hypothetical protein